MSSADNITYWIRLLEAGEAEAAQKLWERYFDQLVRFARDKLSGTNRTITDEEDIALSAFNSFCHGAQNQRFTKLEDRQDLWQLLLMIAARKACKLSKHQSSIKQGGKMRRRQVSCSASTDPIEQLIGREPTPEFAAIVTEEFQRMINFLENSNLQQTAILKMEGFTNQEIAKKMGCVERTVERRLMDIRDLWNKAGIR